MFFSFQVYERIFRLKRRVLSFLCAVYPADIVFVSFFPLIFAILWIVRHPLTCFLFADENFVRTIIIMDKLIYLVPVMGAIGLLYTFIKFAWVSKQDAGSDRMQEIAR